jgi:hypothetical protein
MNIRPFDIIRLVLAFVISPIIDILLGRTGLIFIACVFICLTWGYESQNEAKTWKELWKKHG